MKSHYIQARDLFCQALLANERRRQYGQSNVKLFPILKRQDGDNSQLVFANLECIEFQFFELFEVVYEIEEGVVADDIHALSIAARKIPKHEAKAAPDGLFRKYVGLGRIGPQADDYRDILNIPAFPEHQDADNRVDGAVLPIHVPNCLPRDVEIRLAYLPSLVRVDDLCSISTELGCVGGLKPIPYVIGIFCGVQH